MANPTAEEPADKDSSSQKCYLADTGLLITHTFPEQDSTENALYKDLFFHRIDCRNGMIMEQAVAQMLRRNGHNLCFYSKNDNLHRENHIAIPFLIPDGNKISPIDIKSLHYRSHASLDKFCRKFPDKCGTPYILYPGDVMEKDGILHLPLYMAMFL